MLGLVCAAGGEFRQHGAANCERKQGEPCDHGLAATAKDEKVEHKGEAGLSPANLGRYDGQP
jgi:hypothetical protein